MLLCAVGIHAASIDAADNKNNERAPIVIAVIDDGLVHELDIFKGMLWRNPNEIPNNAKDDDGNGRVDDLIGWDASDGDEDVRPPEGRLSEFTHGTYMSALIAGMIRQHLGEMDDYPIKLMFIKGISDTATYMNMTDGYSGLQIAVDQRADVINLSWSGGEIDKLARNALNEARNRDIFIVGAVGTYPQKQAANPSAHPAVFGVAGIDSKQRLFKSNYGDEVELSALAEIEPKRLLGIDSPDEISGVSNSAAFVTATVALMKQANPKSSNRLIKHCLQATAIPLDHANIDIAGLLGAGELDTESAIECSIKGHSIRDDTIHNSKGSLFHKSHRNGKVKAREWTLAPVGNYDGLTLRPFVEGLPNNSTLSIYSLATANKSSSSEHIWSGLLSDLPATIDTEHTAIRLSLGIESNKSFEFQTKFATQNIDQSVSFCRGEQTVNINDINKPVVIVDGSGNKNYAINTDCKWLLKPKAGHDLVLEFIELDTELNVDSIYLFRGEKTLQTDLLMRISGPKTPPKIVIGNDKALLWFTSNDRNQKPGFKVLASIKPSDPL